MQKFNRNGPDVERTPRPEPDVTRAQMNAGMARAIALQLRHNPKR